MSDYKSYIKVTHKSSDRTFGFIFAAVFLIIGIYPYFFDSPIRLWSVAISCTIFLIASFFPSLLNFFNKRWFYIGNFIGSCMSYIVMFLIFIATIIPIGFLLKVMNKDVVDKKLDKNAKSYWKIKKDKVSLKNQF